MEKDQALKDQALKDQAPKDQAPEQSTPACLTTITSSYWSDPSMMICSGGPFTQCTAENACNVAGGWHLCLASEFLARGGASTSIPTSAWIKGCVRKNGAVDAPVDSLCSASCASTTAGSVTIGWECANLNSSSATDADNVGLVSAPKCSRVGVNTPATAGYWIWMPITSKKTGALCCR